MKSFGIALIGYGGIGGVHAMGYRNIPFHYRLPAVSVKIIGVATSAKTSAKQAAAEIGCAVYSDDYRELLARDDVHVVDCTLPNHLHREVVCAAAAAGKHIYCEKPLSVDVVEAKEMVKAVKKFNVKNQISYNFRFYPAIIRAFQLIQDGELGRIFSFHARYFRSSYISDKRPISWRLQSEYGGGALSDIGSHAIDLVYYLLGDIEAVNATLTTLISKRPNPNSDVMEQVTVDDLNLLHLKTAKGVFGSVEVSRMGTGTANDLRIEIYGQRGSLRFSAQNPSWLEFFSTKDESQPLGGMQGFRRLQTIQHYEGQRSPDWTMPAAFVRTHAECQYQFLQAIAKDRDASPSLEDGLKIQAIMDAARRSSDQNGWEIVQY